MYKKKEKKKAWRLSLHETHEITSRHHHKCQQQRSESDCELAVLSKNATTHTLWLACFTEPVFIDRYLCWKSAVALTLQPQPLDVYNKVNTVYIVYDEALRPLLCMIWGSWMLLVLPLSTKIHAQLINADWGKNTFLTSWNHSAQRDTDMFGLRSASCYHGKLFSVRQQRWLHPSIHPELLLYLHPKQKSNK